MSKITVGRFNQIVADVTGSSFEQVQMIHNALIAAGVYEPGARGLAAPSIDLDRAAWILATLLTWKTASVSLKEAIELLRTGNSGILRRTRYALSNPTVPLVVDYGAGDLTCTIYLHPSGLVRLSRALGVAAAACVMDVSPRRPWLTRNEVGALLS